MRKYILLFVLLIGTQSLIWSNPSDYTPIAKFSELVFDDNNNWTMELYFPIGYGSGIDSIVFNISGIKSKLNVFYDNRAIIRVINSDSLTIPLSINRAGDKIIIYTYAIRFLQDSIIFGNYPGATVGQPDSGYSILRYYTKLASNNYLTIDCLTKKPSLGIVNDLVGLSGTLMGHIYDKDNKLIKNYYTPVGGDGLIFLEDQLNISPDGSYTTSIYNTIYKPGFLVVKMVDWEYFINILNIEPFELINIHPDTVVIQDIHLTDTCLFCTLVDAVRNDAPPKSDELTLINYPNPFSVNGSANRGNLSTNFFVKIPGNMKIKQGFINIYNVRGQLINSIPVHGSSTILWNCKNMNGRIIPSGIYYYRLVIDSQVIKNGLMILLK